MTNPVVRKLELFTRLSADDKAILSRLANGRVRQFNAREDIVREGDAPRDVNLFLGGWACRYKQIEDGRRQIIAFLLPGDLCDLNVFILKEMGLFADFGGQKQRTEVRFILVLSIGYYDFQAAINLSRFLAWKNRLI